MHNHDGTWSFLKLFTTLLFIVLAVWWLQSVLGGNNTILVIFALLGVVIFAGGALFAHLNQKMTLDAVTKFNANDAQIDKFRMQTMKEMTKNEGYRTKAESQIWQLERKHELLDQRQETKLLEAKQREDDEMSFFTVDNFDFMENE